jgi:hypothetical protein
MNTKVKEIVEELIKKTDAGQIDWKKDGEGTFLVTLSVGRVRIHHIPCHAPDDIYEITMCGCYGEGEYKKLTRANEDEEHFRLSKRLYEAARTSHHCIGDTLESILEEIMESENIGIGEMN